MFGEDTKGHGHHEAVRGYMQREMKALLGLEDTMGLQILSLIGTLTHLYGLAESQRPGESELSGPRWRLLALLMAHEEFGKGRGLTPTSLSRMRGVSKNTISSLLRGLEEQGYIERRLDPDDRRVFRIGLTKAGRALVQESAPERAAYINQLAGGLSDGERKQLIALLEKLFHSVLSNSGCTAPQPVPPSSRLPDRPSGA